MLPLAPIVSESSIVVNADGPETRVALIENGILTELFIERDRERSTVGNIYKGRVLRVLPGMQAAFVDIGEEKAAFLYAGDIALSTAQNDTPTEGSGDGIPRRSGKHGDIADLVRPGQEILVQVVKDPISSKGARITSYMLGGEGFNPLKRLQFELYLTVFPLLSSSTRVHLCHQSQPENLPNSFHYL